MSGPKKPIAKVLAGAVCAALVFSAGASAAELFAVGENSDPRLRSAAFLTEDQSNFQALSELLQMNPSGDYSRMPADYQWQLAEAYLNFGMKAKSEEVYRNIALNSTDEKKLSATRLKLAEFEYERGYYDEARTTLYGMRERVPDGQVEAWQDLLARVLMAEGRYDEALEILTDLKNGDRQSPYTRYNLGVAMINTGDLKHGRDVIDRVGRLRPEDEFTLSLRDRANSSLGWHYLKADIAGSAKQSFYRVRSVGPFSNRALLGLGWAELANDSTTSTNGIPEDLTPFSTFATLAGVLKPGFLDKKNDKAVGTFKINNISPAEAEALRRAMVTWVELISRDPLDPAVQEAWLAIPYSLDRLGAHTEALQYYEKAVDKLEDTRKRLDVAMGSIKRNVMLETIVRNGVDAESGWNWKLANLPDTAETYYLQNLLAEHRFQEALKNYRDVRLLARRLEGWKNRLNSLETSYKTRGPGSETPDVLFKRAKQDWVEPWKKINIKLRMEGSLSPPGLTDAPFTPPKAQLPPLQMSPTPDRFNGVNERIVELRGRINNLRDLCAVAGGEQAKLLQNMAIAELQGQKKAVEKYLIEARFALARLYDRELHKDAQPPPEEPVEKGGMLQRFLGVFGAKPVKENKSGSGGKK